MFSLENAPGSNSAAACFLRLRPALLVAALAAILVATPLVADEPLTTDDDVPAKRSTAKPPLQADDEKLLRSLDPAAKDESETEVERLERAIAGMRQANERIVADDTGSATRDLQRRVIADLETLLEQIKRQSSRPPGSPPDPSQSEKQRQDNRRKLSQPQLDPQNSGKRGQPRQQSVTGNEPRSDDAKAREAQERLDAAKAGLADESRRQQMIKDVWGHLPPHLREAMRNAFSEKYLPKYEDLVKRYYEALAEKNRTESERRSSSNR